MGAIYKKYSSFFMFYIYILYSIKKIKYKENLFILFNNYVSENQY